MFPFNLGATCDSLFFLMLNIQCIFLTHHFYLHRSAHSLLLLEPPTRTAWGSSTTCHAPARVLSSLSSCFLGMGASLPYVMPWTDLFPSVLTLDQNDLTRLIPSPAGCPGQHCHFTHVLRVNPHFRLYTTCLFCPWPWLDTAEKWLTNSPHAFLLREMTSLFSKLKCSFLCSFPFSWYAFSSSWQSWSALFLECQHCHFII